MFVIEDEIHAEQCGEYQSRDDAIAELRRRSLIAYDKAPNLAPCNGARHCGRHYQIIEYQTDHHPWSELSRTRVLSISKDGPRWYRAEIAI